MNKALSCYREFSRAYIDDIAIFSKNWEEHLLHLDTILTKLSELNFTVNLKKCVFGKAQIKYLGHIIGSGKHEPDPEKTAVINNLPVPKTKKELRSVLGLCNCYLEAPSLYSPVPDKPYTIHSDASQIGIAACLSQKCGDKCYPIAYASQKLSKTQQSWSTIEREAFAIVWSLKKFEVWVFGTEIEFYTDHNPLPYLTKSAPQSARLQRWAFALQKGGRDLLRDQQTVIKILVRRSDRDCEAAALLDFYDKQEIPAIGWVAAGPEIGKIIELRSGLDIFSSEKEIP
ncbi:retrovirus-related Pol polyprotein from transposon opus [Trichonephila clavipes]|nr:retrovirus-related Pol polyprotein from transposon opus [Trichonephila clavipes]